MQTSEIPPGLVSADYAAGRRARDLSEVAGRLTQSLLERRRKIAQHELNPAPLLERRIHSQRRQVEMQKLALIFKGEVRGFALGPLKYQDHEGLCALDDPRQVFNAHHIGQSDAGG